MDRVFQVFTKTEKKGRCLPSGPDKKLSSSDITVEDAGLFIVFAKTREKVGERHIIFPVEVANTIWTILDPR